MPAPGARAKEPETGQDRKPPDETVAHAAAPSAKPGAEPKPEKPLPPTGLPVAETTTKPSSKSTVNPKEYE